ncbi:MAG: short-chain dehydrogenase [Capnocytophaga sp.]|jgi:hypothetical protein|uniref:hypothetical protein n=1 Tax=Capnocytophaga leadbetteri TaxID=327575 RepID=UPI0017E022D2|nr:MULTISPECIES: hypothetical protein [Capnocytophaga]MBB1568281.1 short-chain dehydrogenase [Capnocytophaga sp.]
MKQIENFTISEFFFDIPLYTEIKITDKNISILEDILLLNKSDISFEGYNPLEKVDSTFIIEKEFKDKLANHTFNLSESYKNPIKIFLETGGYRTINIKCKRYNNIFTFSIFYNAEKRFLLKIGQYPSIADFHIYEIKQYDKLLSNDVLKEFTKAIGLAANGVGIGSFVYLRRIFENLILESFEEAKQEGKVKDEAFNKSRMDEKIGLLKDYLPSFLVENKSIYSILSKGIHELDENTCLEYFDPMKVGIEIILDQKLEKKKQKEKEEEAKKRIAQLNSKLKP